MSDASTRRVQAPGRDRVSRPARAGETLDTGAVTLEATGSTMQRGVPESGSELDRTAVERGGREVAILDGEGYQGRGPAEQAIPANTATIRSKRTW